MAITDKKISEVYNGRDISSLSDNPNQDGMSASSLKARFDQLGKEIIPKYNDLIDELNDTIFPSKIDLDGVNANIDRLQFNTATLQALNAVGQIRWNDTEKTLELRLSNDVTLQIGKETLLRATNKELTTISNGKACYVSGGAGANIYTKLATNTDGLIAQATIGVATEDLIANESGYICTEGIVGGINTDSWNEGDILYLGVGGALINVEPVAPTPKIFVGVVLRKHLSLGSIYVKVRAVPRLQRLSDVFVSSIADGHALIWNGTTGRFENEAIYNKDEVDALANARYTKTEMQTSGQALLHWDNLTNKPNFADASWKPSVANKSSLPLSSNTVGDQRVVLNDGDGKQAIYTCIATTGTVDEQWAKVGDVDWLTEEQTRITQELARVSAEESRVTAEGLRVSAEEDRATEELDRQSQENTRISNENIRISNENTRISNENTRISQESSRVSAESTRVSQENARNVFVEYNGSTTYVVGNKVFYNGASYRCKLNSVGNLPTNTTYWDLIAGVITDALNVVNTPSGNISATTVQGAINELDTEKAPTVHTHDDRYYTETEVNTLLNAKANITQEAWITPTLVNSWVRFNSTLNTVQYYKDSVGVVRLRGIIKSGVAGLIFTLPTGYRPSTTSYFATVSNALFGYLTISEAGDVTAIVYNNTWISLENMSFKAEL